MKSFTFYTRKSGALGVATASHTFSGEDRMEAHVKFQIMIAKNGYVREQVHGSNLIHAVKN